MRQTKGKTLVCEEFEVEFKVKYQTKPGQKLFVMGSIKELGNWEEFECGMIQIEDNCWITANLRITQPSHFQYKYAVKGYGDQEVIWEQGMVRIADLAILPLIRQSKDGLTKFVQLFDVWDHYTVKFGVTYPTQSFSQNKRFLRINGSRDELGTWHTDKGPRMK